MRRTGPLAPDHNCIVCGAFGRVALGIRARTADTNAVWAPNLDAYLCDEHAVKGCVIEIVYHPADDGRVRVQTAGPRRTVQTVLVIGSGVKEIPGQERLC